VELSDEELSGLQAANAPKNTINDKITVKNLNFFIFPPLA
jgi:hypothetical protein